MKKFYLLPLLASLFFVGCSQDEPASGTENDGNGSNTSYLAVNMVSSDITGTRAAEGYEDGSTVENKVKKVRFYFFTENGASTPVKLKSAPDGSTSYVNYYDWEPGKDDQSDDTNTGDDVESKLKATIVINTKDGDKLPQKIAAVLNPTNVLGEKSKSLDELKGIAENYANADYTNEGTFVMFNAVYGNGGSEFCAVPVEAKHLCKTEDDAKKSPVILYVERNVAKVKASLSSSVGFQDGKLALKDKDEKSIIINGQQVYLKINGWRLTAETNEGRLVKKINTSWTSDWWNGTHRSFWAINSDNAQNVYYSYNQIKGSPDALYTNENAAAAADDKKLNKTKVIYSGTLCTADDKPITLVRHLGVYLVDSFSATDEAANMVELKKSILAQLKASGHNYYYDGTVNGKPGREGISTKDLKIVVASQQQIEDSQNNCYVYAELTDAAKKKTWYNSMKDDATALTDAATTINDDLKNKEVVDWALVWNSGMTYYYFEIIHNGTGENATKGVVRNHIYKTTVTKIAGLGTPVYDPNETIYPEKPDPNDHYIAAQINILSWRIVENNYELDW